MQLARLFLTGEALPQPLREPPAAATPQRVYSQVQQLHSPANMPEAMLRGRTGRASRTALADMCLALFRMYVAFMNPEKGLKVL